MCFVRDPKAWRCYCCVRLRVVGIFCRLYRGGRAFCLECDSRTFASAGSQRFRCLFFRSPASGSVKLVWSKPAGREQVCFVREPKAWRRTGKRCYRCVRLRVVGLFCGLYRGGRAFCLECDSSTFASAGRQRFRYVTALSHIYTHYLELSTGFSKRGRSCYNYFKTFNFPCFS